MVTLRFLTLFILILIARPFGTPIPAYRQAANFAEDIHMAKTQQVTPEETWEPEMPLIWLVRDPETFGTKGQTSAKDHSLGLRLTYQEWLAIYFDVLGLDKSGFEKTATRLAREGQGDSFLTEFDDDIPGFPMLSRIRGPYHEVVFTPDELEELHKECARLQESTTNVLALRGLQKLNHAYDQARQLNLSIYFVSN